MIMPALSALWTFAAPRVANHLWQSTLFAVVAALLALALRKNQARARYWIWMAASLKFLVPFSLLVTAGGYLATPRAVAPAQTGVYSAIEEVGQPFAQPEAPLIYQVAPSTTRSAPVHLLPALLVAAWLIGVIVVLSVWEKSWIRVSMVMREAEPLFEGREREALRRLEPIGGVRKRIRLLLSRNWMEPGIFGIFRPVLIWPEGISQHLDDRHIEAILAHEICHVRRRDNLTAAIHMLVEAIFWFHPLVWWLGARLEEERERACDEEVMLLCGRPHVYAESILKVCKFCSESPLACISGITGANLKKRVMQIMTNGLVHKLDFGRKLLLLAVGLLAVSVPIMLGQVKVAQRVMLAATNAAPAPLREPAHAMIAEEQIPSTGEIAEVQADAKPFKFDVVSIRPADPNVRPVLLAQTTPAPAAPSSPTTDATPAPSFDAATIKPHSPEARSSWVGIRDTPDGLNAISTTLQNLIHSAYGLQIFDQISGAPDWAKADMFDMQAKMSETDIAGMQKLSSAEATARRQLMLQALLAERFKLKVHSEAKQVPVFELVVAKANPKLKDAATDASDTLRKDKDGKPMTGIFFLNDTSVAQGQSMKSLATLLSAPFAFVGRPVIDKTGLTGTYDFTLNWSVQTAPLVNGVGTYSTPSDDAPSIFGALQEVGLKLQPATGPIEIIVIDHAEHPTEN